MKYNHLHLFIALLWSIIFLLDIATGSSAWRVVFHLLLILCYLETGAAPIRRLVAYIRQRVEFHREAQRRRARYEQLRRDVKSGLVGEGEIEETTRRVVE